MEKSTFNALMQQMHSALHDSAHDREHVLRVLHHALAIAEGEGAVDFDVLIAACLLHDIARPAQMADPAVCHALRGGDMAFDILCSMGFPQEKAEHVRQCIRTHRFRKASPPASIEAKILYDADKLDAIGAVGMARALVYNGAAGEPIYSRRADGTVSDGTGDTADSFCHEYRFKLERLHEKFLTARGAVLARERQKAAAAFYQALMNEVQGDEMRGNALLQGLLT